MGAKSIGGLILKKIIWFVMSLAFLSITLIGCQSKDATPSQADEEILKVSVSKSSGFDKVNPDFFIVFEDEASLDIFERVITKSVKNPGIADRAEPEFDFEAVYANGNKRGFHLWLGEEGQRSTLTHILDNHITYTISEEMTNKLIDLLRTP